MKKIQEVPIPRQRHLYKIYEIDAVTGKRRDTSRFRVRRRVRSGSKWGTETHTFDSFEKAREFRNQAPTGIATRKRFNSQANSGWHLFPSVFKRFIVHKTTELQLAASTIEKYRVTSRHFVFFDDTDLRTITPRVVDQWINFLHDPEYKKTQNATRTNYDHEYTLLSNVLRYYQEYENNDFSVPLMKRHRNRMCSKSKSARKEIRYLNSHQQESFLSEVTKQSELLSDIAIVQLDTGMRISELCALQARQIILETNEIIVDQHLDWERKRHGKINLVAGTKGGASRLIPMTERCRAVIERLLIREGAKGKLFEHKGDWVHYRFIQNGYDKCFRKLQYRHSGTHTLRHSFAVSFLETTKDIHALQQLLGHANLAMTQHYAKYTNESVRRSFKVFNGGKRGGDVSPFVSREVV